LRETGKTKKTIVDFYNFCREVCAVILEQQSQPIGRPGKLVEIDESKLEKESIIAVSELTASGSSAVLKETVHHQSAFFRLCLTDLLPPLFP